MSPLYVAGGILIIFGAYGLTMLYVLRQRETGRGPKRKRYPRAR